MRIVERHAGGRRMAKMMHRYGPTQLPFGDDCDPFGKSHLGHGLASSVNPQTVVVVAVEKQRPVDVEVATQPAAELLRNREVEPAASFEVLGRQMQGETDASSDHVL